MATEEVKEAVVEEPIDTEETEEELSPWYYFFSQGCGWCKKSSPVVESLNENGHDILMLDLAEPDNQKLNKELQDEYGTKCGTPWFINADTGKGVCGFREKDVLEKWLDGEDIPEPPRPSGPPPKVPFQGSTNEENIKWKKEYNEWLKNNDHMPDDWVSNQRSASTIIDAPRPKSDPPRPPMTAQTTDVQLDNWGEDMKAWQKENKHLPNLQPVDNIVQQLKSRRNQMPGAAPQIATGGTVDNSKLNSMDARVQALEVKIDKIMNHFGVK